MEERRGALKAATPGNVLDDASDDEWSDVDDDVRMHIFALNLFSNFVSLQDWE